MSRAGLLVAGLLIGMLVAELLLRPSTFPQEMLAGTTKTKRAKLYGWALEPDTTIDFRIPDSGESVPFVINSQGWKDVEHTITKPPGTVRILVLGDSYTFGYVPLESLYTRKLDELLKQRGYASVEVLSMGVAGWGTDQELEALKREGMAFSPDIVICQFCANDLHNNLEPLVPEWTANPFDSIHTKKTFCYVLEGGELRKVKIQLRPKNLRRRVKDGLLRSAVIYRLNLVRQRIRGGGLPGSGLADAQKPDDMSKARREARLDPTQPGFLYAPDDGSRQRYEKWALQRALYAQMQATAREGGALFAVFSEAGDLGRQDYFLQRELIRRDGEFFFIPWEGKRVAFDIRQPLRDLEEICAALNIPVISPQRSYRRYQTDPHTNAAGNVAMAEDIADFLLSQPAFRRVLEKARSRSAAGTETPPQQPRGNN